MIRKTALVLALLTTFALMPSLAFATCADGGIAPNAACHTSTACSTSQGNTFTGTCVGASTNTTGTAKLLRCSGPAICAGSTPLGSGCSSDGQCVSQFGSGYICVVDGDAGVLNCGTGFSQCILSCSDSTTTTTTTTSTTTTTA